MGQLLSAYTTEENVSHLPSNPQLYKHPMGEGEVGWGGGGEWEEWSLFPPIPHRLLTAYKTFGPSP